MDARPEQEVGGICSAILMKAYFARSIQWVLDIFAFITENTPATFSATPQGHPLPASLPCRQCIAAYVLEWGGRGCVEYSLYLTRETPPCFSATPWYTPSLSGSRGPPTAEATAPALTILNRHSAPAGRAWRMGKYTVLTQNHPEALCPNVSQLIAP